MEERKCVKKRKLCTYLLKRKFSRYLSLIMNEKEIMYLSLSIKMSTVERCVSPMYNGVFACTKDRKLRFSSKKWVPALWWCVRYNRVWLYCIFTILHYPKIWGRLVRYCTTACVDRFTCTFYSDSIFFLIPCPLRRSETRSNQLNVRWEIVFEEWIKCRDKWL